MDWDVGFDIGTGNIRIAEAGSSVVITEPALLAYREGRESPICGGLSAARVNGHSCANAYVRTALRDGTLESASHFRQLLRWAYSHMEFVDPARRFGALMTCAPFTRPVQCTAMLEAALDAGAYVAGLVRSDTAAAIGAGLEINEPEGRLVIDVGAGKITATLFTMGHIAAFGYLPYGLSRVDERVVRILRSRAGYRVSLSAAREIKHTLGCAQPDAAEKDVIMHAVGFSLEDRLPRTFDVETKPILDACEDVVRELSDMCVGMLSGAPAELLADLNDTGCTLTGAGAVMTGLESRLSEAIGVECHVAPYADECAARGLKYILEHPNDHASSFMGRRNAAAYRRQQ